MIHGKTIGTGAVLGAALLLGACAEAQLEQHAPKSPRPQSKDGVLRAVTVARDLEHPWAMVFLPDGRMLVTERPGRMRIVEASGKLSEPLGSVPRVHARGQGGLLDVILDP